MKLKRLGNTEVDVSIMGLGTVELGIDYGIRDSGNYGRPDIKKAKRIINKALDYGINLFDTAPAYGDSESILGEVIGQKQCYIATKVSIPDKDIDIKSYVLNSVERSIRNLRRQRLDIVQIHNVTIETIKKTDMPEVLVQLKRKGMIGFIGASVYGEGNAQAVLDSGVFDILQIAYNLLDRSMAKKVIPRARKEGVGMLGRSIYLQGVFTPKIEYLDERFKPLKDMVNDLNRRLNIKDMQELARIALRFCISGDDIDSALIGTAQEEHLDFAIDCVNQGRLDDCILKKINTFNAKDKHWLNPRNWPVDK